MEELIEGLALIGEWSYRVGSVTGVYPVAITPYVRGDVVIGYMASYENIDKTQKALPAFSEIFKMLKHINIPAEVIERVVIMQVDDKPAIMFLDADYQGGVI